MKTHINEIDSSTNRLIQAALTLWERQGLSATSVRSVAHDAGLPVSSIYHHFGSLEHLYLSAQAHARAETDRWCAAQLDALTIAGTSHAGGFRTMLAALIDDWTEGQRRLAFAWRECAMWAARDERIVAELNAWRALWRSFWQSICDRFGRSEHGEVTMLFFYSESIFHLMRWRRAIDRAALDDLCAGWSMWLDGTLAPEGPWRRAAREEAIRTMASLPVLGELSGRIAQAAADLLQREGLARLTHRAVAAEAGLTLGVVSHNLRTSADLVRAAFEMVYRRISGNDGTDLPPLRLSDEQIIERISGYQGDPASLLALNELLLAAARDPSLSTFVPQLRYLRGRTSRTMLSAIAGRHELGSPLDHALLSAFVSGQRQACIGLSPEDTRTLVERSLATLFRSLRG